VAHRGRGKDPVVVVVVVVAAAAAIVVDSAVAAHKRREPSRVVAGPERVPWTEGEGEGQGRDGVERAPFIGPPPPRRTRPCHASTQRKERESLPP
jgi:hypothetical protein